MNKISLNLEFSSPAEALFAIKNLAVAQSRLAESMLSNGYDSEAAYSIRTLSEVINQASDQLACDEMGQERLVKSIVEV